MLGESNLQRGVRPDVPIELCGQGGVGFDADLFGLAINRSVGSCACGALQGGSQRVGDESFSVLAGEDRKVEEPVVESGIGAAAQACGIAGDISHKGHP